MYKPRHIIILHTPHQPSWPTFLIFIMMRETQEDYYLVLFMFASQLYFYVLGPISLLGY